jgi:BirA family biotin operon repressor/biotin-[acetyl-CoA-carboxylase] ligase
VFAEHQTAGRGRRGSHWLAPPHSSILCSVAVWMPDAPGQGALVTRAAAVAGAEAIEAQCRLNVGVRWPNDLVIDDRKVGGILVEARPAAGERGPVVIGIGINCTQGAEAFPPEIRRGVASLAMFSEDVDRTLLARSLLERLDEVLTMVAEPPGGVEVRRRAAARCRTLGQRITVIEDGKTYCGQVVDLDPDYGLVLRLEEGGIQRFAAMTCHVVGPNRQWSDR